MKLNKFLSISSIFSVSVFSISCAKTSNDIKEPEKTKQPGNGPVDNPSKGSGGQKDGGNNSNSQKIELNNLKDILLQRINLIEKHYKSISLEKANDILELKKEINGADSKNNLEILRKKLIDTFLVPLTKQDYLEMLNYTKTNFAIQEKRIGEINSETEQKVKESKENYAIVHAYNQGKNSLINFIKPLFDEEIKKGIDLPATPELHKALRILEREIFDDKKYALSQWAQIFKEAQYILRVIDKEEYNKIIKINNEIINLDENQINQHIWNIKKNFIKNIDKYLEYDKKLEVLIEKFKELLAKIATYSEKNNDSELKKTIEKFVAKMDSSDSIEDKQKVLDELKDFIEKDARFKEK